MNIDVKMLSEDPWEFVVMLRDDGVHGEYNVTMHEDDFEHYGHEAEPSELIEATFKFLLAREEPDMILESFGLSDVEKYYPEYSDEIVDYL